MTRAFRLAHYAPLTVKERGSTAMPTIYQPLKTTDLPIIYLIERSLEEGCIIQIEFEIPASYGNARCKELKDHAIMLLNALASQLNVSNGTEHPKLYCTYSGSVVSSEKRYTVSVHINTPNNVSVSTKETTENLGAKCHRLVDNLITEMMRPAR